MVAKKKSTVRAQVEAKANSAWSHTKAFAAKPIVTEVGKTAAMAGVASVVALGVFKGAKALGVV